VFSKPELASPLRFISLAVIPMTLYQFHAEGLRGLKRIAEYALLHNAGRFIFGTLAFVGLVIWMGHLVEPTLLFSIGALLTFLASLWLWKLHFGWAAAGRGTDGQRPTPSLRSIFDLAIPLMLASSATFLMNWTDILLLTYLRSFEEVAVYSIAFKFATISKLVLMGINSIAGPKFAEIEALGQSAALENTVRQSTKLIFWLSLPVIFVLMVFPKAFLGIYGDEYLAGAACLMILAAGQFFAAICGSTGQFLQMTGHQVAFQRIMISTAVVNILLNLVLIPAWGINGAAVAGFLTIIMRNTISVIFIYRKHHFLTLYVPLLTR